MLIQEMSNNIYYRRIDKLIGISNEYVAGVGIKSIQRI